MTFRTFTLKDFATPEEAARAHRLAALRPMTSADLAAAGMRFVELPEVGAELGRPLAEGERIVLPEGSQTEEQLRLARDWLNRQP